MQFYPTEKQAFVINFDFIGPQFRRPIVPHMPVLSLDPKCFASIFALVKVFLLFKQ